MTDDIHERVARCEFQVPTRQGGDRQCKNNAAYERDGVPLCSAHRNYYLRRDYWARLSRETLKEIGDE